MKCLFTSPPLPSQPFPSLEVYLESHLLYEAFLELQGLRGNVVQKHGVTWV